MRRATKCPSEKIVTDNRRANYENHSSKVKIRIVLNALRGEDGITVQCQRKDIS